MTRQRRAPADYPRMTAEDSDFANSRRSAWPVALSPLAVEVCRSGQSGAGGQSPVGGPGSGVVVFVPQLVSKAARRGDRLDGEAVFEAA